MLIKGLLWGAPSPGAHDPSLLNGRTVELIGRLHADARVFDTSCSALIAVDRIDGRRFRGRTEVVLQPCLNPPQQGWQLKLTGALKAPQAGVHRLVSGPASRLHRLGSWSQLRADQWQVLHKSWTPIADARRSVAARFQQVAGPQRGGLLAALVLGGAQVQLPAELREAFRVAGLSHALAASGFHLSVVLGAVLAIARGLSRPFRVSLGCSALLMFLTLAGGQPSVVRAVLMGATALLIRESDQRSRGAGVLLLTLILMLLIRPDWAHSVGFQLSAAATAGLTLSAPGVEQQLLRCCPSRIRWLASAIAVSWAALIWTLPLQLLPFGSTPLYALVANLLAAPLLAPLTLSAMGLAVAALLLPHPLLVGLSWPVQQLAGMLISLVHWISHWPAAQLLTGHPQPWVVLMMAFGLIPGYQLPSRTTWFWRGDSFECRFSPCRCAAGGWGCGCVALWPPLAVGSSSRSGCSGEYPCRTAKLSCCQATGAFPWTSSFGLDCSVGSCGFGGDGMLDVDGGACPGSASGTPPPVEGTTLAERGPGALVAN